MCESHIAKARQETTFIPTACPVSFHPEVFAENHGWKDQTQAETVTFVHFNHNQQLFPD